MQLNSLLNTHGKTVWGPQAPIEHEIKDLVFDSRQAKQNSLFFALKGVGSDGHSFIPQVIKAGCRALVVEDTKNIPADFKGTYHLVLNSRWAMHEVGKIFYNSPGENLFSVAVTGTNGKTSTTYIIEKILNSNSLYCGVIGTINHHFKETIWDSNLTTPDDLSLQKRLAEFLDLGAKSFAMEASSHALHQQRLLQKFDVAVFTNLTRDHLDYHKNMDDYFAAKELLFKNLFKDNADTFAIINNDDVYGQKINVARQATKLTYGQSPGDFQILDVVQSLEALRFKIKYKNNIFEVDSPLMGEHNAYNLTAGFAVGMTQGILPQRIIKAIGEFTNIPGRMERVKCSKNNVHCFVDYSHTPDALEKALLSINKVKTSGHKVTTVFGCGGDRDQGKRPLMAEVAEKFSDHVIVTSDNPRTEDPLKIIEQIKVGFKKSNYKVKVDRKLAIQTAIEQSNSGDVVLVAGKGHESYQIIGDKVLPFSDQEVIREF